MLILPRRKIEDVFSTDLYTGTSGTQSITNGVDLVAKGGLVINKHRFGTYTNEHWCWVDTERGANRRLSSNLTDAQDNADRGASAFLSNGFQVRSNDATTNFSGAGYASWTFAQNRKFFDVVTYTGDGVAGRSVSHRLKGAPGMVIVKRRILVTLQPAPAPLPGPFAALRVTRGIFRVKRGAPCPNPLPF